MAITITNLTSGSAASGTSGNTASITPVGNKLILVTVGNYLNSGTANTPTITGCGLTFVQLQTATGQTNSWRITMFRAMVASPSSGALTIDFGGQDQTAGFHWIVDQVEGVKTTGTNGSDAVVQSGVGTGGGTGTGNLVTLSAFTSTDNFAYGSASAQGSITVGSGFTQAGNAAGGVAGGAEITSEYKNNDNTVDWSWSSVPYGNAVAAELAYQEPSGGGILLFM